jgi:hypothetical protein
MNYVIIVLVANAAAFFLLLSNRFSKVRENKVFDFIISLIATFIGLFMAFYFTNIETQKSERDKTIQILETMNNDIEFWRIMQIYTYSNLYDSIKKQKQNISLESFIKEKPVENPILLDTYFTNEQIIRIIHPRTYYNILKLYRFSQVQQRELNNLSDTNTIRTKEMLLTYRKNFNEIMYYIAQEIGRMRFHPDDPPYVKRDTIDGVIYIDGEEEFINQMKFDPDELPKHFKKK